MSNKTFILGASGYIGSNLVQRLKVKHNVVKLGRNHDEVYFDLASSYPQALSDLVCEGDVFIFLAAISSPESCRKNKDFAFTVNVSKTIELINWLVAKHVKVVFSSSDVVFGKKTQVAYDDDFLEPLGDYAEMKMLVENAFAKSSFVKIIRFSYVYGKQDKFSTMVTEAESEGVIVKVFRGFNRNIVSLDDVLQGIEILIKQWDAFAFNAVNFSGPTLVSRVDFINAIKKDILPNLEFEATDAPSSFWMSRAKSIATDCTNFSIILGRKPQGLSSLKEVW
jgi:nucleoside-diphosphate-sugar epimerase